MCQVQGLRDHPLPERDDATLVAAVLSGRKEDFGLLYDRYAPLVRAVCYDATRDLAEAQDMAQDVFVRAFRNLASLRDREQFARWLIGIARLRCREWRRSVARDRRNRPDGAALEAVAADPPDLDGLEDLRQAIASLPEQERLALRIFYVQEQPADAAQLALGLSRSGFYKLLDRARGRLRELMGCRQEDIQ
jgi:RNA polymerase sigma-70 factor (ECF subfamily)